jgi:hypothetical protein
MAEVSDLLPLAMGPGAVALWEFGKWLVLGRLSKAEKAVDDAEKAEKNKLDSVLAIVTKMEKELGVMTEKLLTQTGSISEVKARIDGISKNHGERLAVIEKDVVELRTLLRRRK